MVDDVGYCSCMFKELGDYSFNPSSGSKVEAWWEEHTFKTPLFDLEPNFFPAFTLDSFFPRIPRTSTPS